MGLTKAYARIEELEQENAQLRLQIDMLKMERENDGWIPCSVRIPDDDDYVLVTLKSDEGEIFTDGSTAYYDGKLWRWSDECMAIQSDVLAWQPLPEPYKGDVDATK